MNIVLWEEDVLPYEKNMPRSLREMKLNAPSELRDIKAQAAWVSVRNALWPLNFDFVYSRIYFVINEIDLKHG